MPLSQGTAIALTTAFYYTPSGRSIQRSLPGQLAKTTTGGGTGRHQAGPDRLPEAMTPLRAVLDATGSFTYVRDRIYRRVRTIPPNFEVTPAFLDEFQAMLSERNITAGTWRSGLAKGIGSRAGLKQEILNQGIGVAKGDEVELQRDPVALAALEAIGVR